MFEVKRLTTQQSEEDLAKLMIEHVRKNNMTILNLKDITAKVVNYLEANAILEMEDSDSTESPSR